MNISCHVIEDLVPLYCDDVCSDESMNIILWILQRAMHMKSVMETGLSLHHVISGLLDRAS